MIESEANPQDVAPDIGHDILRGKLAMKGRRRFPAKGQKTGMLLIAEGIEQFKTGERRVLHKLRLQSRDMV